MESWCVACPALFRRGKIQKFIWVSVGARQDSRNFRVCKEPTIYSEQIRFSLATIENRIQIILESREPLT